MFSARPLIKPLATQTQTSQTRRPPPGAAARKTSGEKTKKKQKRTGQKKSRVQKRRLGAGSQLTDNGSDNEAGRPTDRGGGPATKQAPLGITLQRPNPASNARDHRAGKGTAEQRRTPGPASFPATVTSRGSSPFAEFPYFASTLRRGEQEGGPLLWFPAVQYRCERVRRSAENGNCQSCTPYKVSPTSVFASTSSIAGAPNPEMSLL